MRFFEKSRKVGEDKGKRNNYIKTAQKSRFCYSEALIGPFCETDAKKIARKQLNSNITFSGG